MNNVLVTGGAGYIGSHTCRALAGAGFQPVTIDNLCLGHRSFVRWGPLIEADIRDTEAVTAAIRKHDVVAVMHFAAFAYVGESITEPAKYYDNNVVGTLSILQAMRAAGLQRIVLSSSCAVYGSPNTDLISEQTLAQPINPYGQSKLVCETILADFASAYDLDYIALRYFNASGAEPGAGIGEDREVETHLIPRLILALQGHVDDFSVFGSDFPTPDGTAVRDYIHVSDLADAHVLALKHLLNGAKRGCFNLGTGRGHSVQEILDAVARISGRFVQAPTGSRRQGDPARLVADPRLAQEVLRFQPVRSDIQTIIQDAWRWHAALPNPLVRNAVKQQVM